MAGVNQLGVDALRFAAEAGRVVGPRQVHQDQIGALARFQRPDEVLHVQRARAQPGGHRHGLRRGQDGGIVAGVLRHQRRQPHLLEHVQVVVGRRAVGADADVNPGLEHVAHRRDPRSQLEVRGRVVNHAGVVALQDSDLAFVHMNAMRGHDLDVEDAVLFDVGDDRRAVFHPAVAHLQGGLGQVDLQGRIELSRQVRAGAQDLRGAGERRMRRDRRHDQRMTLPGLQERAGHLQRLLERRGVRRGELEHGLAQHPAQPRLGRGAGHAVLEVVHVGETGDAGADHLGAGQLGAQVHEFGGNELALHRHHIAEQPHVQAQVVSQAAQQGHRRVAVRVDQPRHQHLAAAVDDLGCRELAAQLRFGPDRGDVIALHRDRAGFVLGQRRVHGQDDGVGEEQRGVF